MANVIQKVQRPTLVLAHNKTLAGQLYSEFELAVMECYYHNVAKYNEKDASINDEIDKLRHSATASLFETRDVIVVASVSCIYGLRRSY